MNINELYLDGVSSAWSRVFMNPLRRVLFKLMRPYFNRLISEFDKSGAQFGLENRFNTIETRMRANSKDVEAMGHRFNTIETRMYASSKDVEAMGHRFNTIETRMHASSRDVEAMGQRFNGVEAKVLVASQDMETACKRFDSIEFELKDHFAQLCDIRAKFAESSFSQIGEDRIVAYIFERMGIRLGDVKYLDLGAAFPAGGNNTYLFYLNGASGCLVEADPSYFPEYAKLRQRDMALHAAVLPQAMIDKDRKGVFYRASDPGWSTASRSHLEIAVSLGKSPDQTQSITVPALSMSDILAAIDFEVDFLSIDIEGLDLDVIGEMDFSVFRPKVIVVENRFRPDTNTFSPELQPFLDGHGYTMFASTYVNSIFVDRVLMKNIKF